MSNLKSKKYLIVDLETSGETTFKRFCNPLDPRHEITAIATYIQDGEAHVRYEREGISRDNIFEYINLDEISIIVGQNLKFDLLYMWENAQLQDWIRNGGKVWDTQTVEYLLNGQDTSKRDLDTLAVRYGGQVKDDRVKFLFEHGTQAKDIDPDLLIPYARYDVLNTNLVLQGQLTRASTSGMFPLIKTYMEHYLAIVEMEYQGLHIDLPLAWKMKDTLEEEIKNIVMELTELVFPFWPEQITFNPSSNEHVSAILFGGDLPYVEARPQQNDEGELIVYKSGTRKGQIKTKQEKTTANVPGYGAPFTYTWTKQNGNYSTEDKVLNDLLKLKGPWHLFINKLLIYREKVKLLTTYLYAEERYKTTGEMKKTTGFIPLVLPKTGCVHSEFKTAFTRTGRLASRSPNVQNLPPDILGIFNSRFENGHIIEFDYSQLEVRVQAYLAQCPKMIEDIKNGIDFHCKRLAYAEGLPYEEVVTNCHQSPVWKLKRKQAKTISFQKAYGAQPAKIAESSGLPLHVVEKVFREEDLEYPEINQYYELIHEEMKASRISTPELIKIRDKRRDTVITRPGEYEGRATYKSLTGKLYTFEEKAVLTKAGKVFRYFSMPDIQDYPIQGTAADIVAAQVGKAYRFLLNHQDKAVMVNEVHDSLVLDVKSEYLDWTIEKICAILEDVRTTFQTMFGIDFNVPIKVDYAYGHTWHEAKIGG